MTTYPWRNSTEIEFLHTYIKVKRIISLNSLNNYINNNDVFCAIL